MPMEHAKPGVSPFTRDLSDFPHLRIDNAESEWDLLRIGHHRWFCGELERIASHEGWIIHVRFLRWSRAVADITDTYRGGYDVFQCPTTWTAHLISEGLVEQYKEFNTEDYPPALLKTCRIEGQEEYWVVPWHLDFRLLFYTRALTEQPQELATFAGFEHCLRRRAAEMAGIGTWDAPMGMGATNEWDVFHNPLHWAFQGTFIAQGWGRWWAACDTRGARQGLRRLWRLAQEDLIRFNRKNPDADDVQWKSLAEALVDGRVDAVIGGPFLRSIFDQADGEEICAAPLPEMEKGRSRAFLGGSHLGISSAVARRGTDEMARRLVKRLSGYEFGVGLYRNTDAMPARKDAFAHFISENRRWHNFDLVVKSAEPYPSIPEWAGVVESEDIRRLFFNAIDSIARKEKWETVEAQLVAASDQLDDELTPWWWRPALGILAAAVLAGLLVLMWRLRSAYAARREAERIVRHLKSELKDLSKQLGETRADSLDAHQALRKLEVIEQRLGDVAVDLSMLRFHMPKGIDGALGGIEEEITGLEDLTEDSINVRLDPNRPALSDCTLEARIQQDLDTKKLSVEIDILHGDPEQRLNARPLILCRERCVRLFELVVRRYVASPFGGYLTPADFLYTSHEGLGGRGGKPEGFLETAMKPVSRLRKVIAYFIRRHCTLTTCGVDIRVENIVFSATRCGQLSHSGKTVQAGDNIEKFPDDVGHTSQLSQSKLEQNGDALSDLPFSVSRFVAPDQFKEFKCNIAGAYEEAERCAGNPVQLLKILRDCPRCILVPQFQDTCGPEALARLPQENRNRFRGMLETEVERCKLAAKQCKDIEGAPIEALARAAKMGHAEFSMWADLFKKLGEAL